MLIGVIEREKHHDPKRAEVAVIAALLHDLGHGPFSHTFEGVQKSRGLSKRHETWTAEIIRNSKGSVYPLLETHWPEGGFCGAVADLLEAEDPLDIFHAVVSSSFDSDRLDYLRRDKLMTGTGAGAIDFDWLMEQVRVREIEIEAADAEQTGDLASVKTFCFDPKALPAAEQFLLARYTLHEQVYFHKTTRCVEQMIAKLLRHVADELASSTTFAHTGLDRDHPLVRFFTKEGDTLQNYLSLDDIVVVEGFQRMLSASNSEIADLSARLCNRRLYKSLDLGAFGYDEGIQRREARRIDGIFKEKIVSGSVIKDEGAAVNIYTQIGGDDERAHKRLHILDSREGPVEITRVSKIIDELREPKKFTRYYFENETDRGLAQRRKGEMV